MAGYHRKRCNGGTGGLAAKEQAIKLYREFSTQEEIDAAYNVELMVPSLALHVDRFVGDSARARRDLTCTVDVRFGPTRDETMDIFPAANPGAPVVVFIHGGYWRL
ncbi:MAG: hypothetical protein EXR83_10795 [Gammaproteobacteria bacterium]|nr:hypothetical protein [Gammaproteobacteria bacterium]